ncbi:MAG: prepilin peptidase [Patescibacteria group bacterium]
MLLEFVPFWYQVILVFAVGSIIGSFLNVVIYRLNTGRSLAGRSHCLSCGQQLRWFELIPVVSYIGLRGRCARCGSMISPRYVLVEVGTGLLFVASYLAVTSLAEYVIAALVMCLLVVIVVYDINHFIIPNQLVAGLLVLAVMANGYQWYQTGATSVALYNVLAAVSATAFFGFLWYVSRGKWLGFGDVKLVFPLAWLVGFGQVYSFVVLSFVIGAVISIGLLVVQRGQSSLRFFGQPLTMKSEVPFGPFLAAGFLAAYLWSVDVLALMSYVLG